jgi:phytoene desaturase
LVRFFETVEPGAGDRLTIFMREAGLKYALGMRDLVHRPALSWWEFARPDVLRGMLRSSVLTSMRRHVAAHFKHPRLRALMEFPVLFLGATPEHTPALYSLMNYADMVLGTWYPIGGMGRVVLGMQKLAEGHGVRFELNTPVLQVRTENGRAVGVRTTKGDIAADVVVATADYHHVEQALLPPELRSYPVSYWQSRVMAPSALLFYIGFSRRVPGLLHHNLFFDRPFDAHASEIYEHPRWPTEPLIYVCMPSATDSTVAPPGHENVFVLMPIATGLTDTPEVRERYFRHCMARLEERCGVPLQRHLVLKHSYCINDFQNDYNAFRGNAYGLANTLGQTAVWKPRMKSKKVKALYYAGQLTVPGPGVPPALISGQVVADLVAREYPSMA